MKKDIGGIEIEDWQIEYAPVTIRKMEKPQPRKKVVKKKPANLNPVKNLTEKGEDNNNEIPDVDIEDDDFEGLFGEKVHNPEIVRNDAEVLPAFQCEKNQAASEAAIWKFLAQHVRYPSEARQRKISGTVYVQFVVDKNGEVSNIEVLKGVGGGCTEEAIRVVKKMKNWCPGTQRGIPVSVRYKLPIRFTLKN